MANRFSDIAKQMGANVDDEANAIDEKGSVEINAQAAEIAEERKDSSESMTQTTKVNVKIPETIPTTRKTTALPLVLDIAIKEAKERRNIANKIKRVKKITEDDVVVEALQLYFRKTENRSFLDAAYEKLKFFQ